MVILKTSTKYRKFFPNLVIKTTDFRLVLNFEQTRTFTIFGEHGIIRWAHTICLCNRLLFYSKRYWIYRLFYLQRYYNQWLQTSTHTELYLVSFQQIMFKLGKLTDFKEPLQLPCWQFSLAFWDKKIRRQLMLIPPSGRPSCTFFRSPQAHKARKGRRRPGERGRHEECHGINYDFWLGQWQS